ncbi:MAG: conserved membrane protein of unknown function [Promethearchaeota archaeon]|nr:MAG: conserved membrane protein of unknown function [Candidatus Lokiarchaeota archaeon]
MKIERFDVFYIIGLLFSSIVMILLILFFFYGSTLINFTYVIFYWTIKFLSGFGLILTVTNVFLLLLKFTRKRISKRTLNVFIFVQVISCVVLIGYSIYSIISNMNEIQSAPSTRFLEWIDILLFSFGLVSISLSLYLIPLFREEFQDSFDDGVFSRFRGGLKKVGRGVKKKYYTFRRDHVNIQIKDHTTIKEILEIWRSKFATYLLIPLGIGSFIFTPITFVCLVFWFRFFILDEEPTSYERVCLILSIFFIITVSILSYIFEWILFTSISEYLWSIYLFYSLGIVLGSGVFIYHFTKLKGVTLADIADYIKDIL